MSDNDPLDVEIEIDLGLEEPEEKTSSEERPEAPIASTDSEPKDTEAGAPEPEPSIDEIAASLASAIEEADSEADDGPGEEPDVDEIAASLADAIEQADSENAEGEGSAPEVVAESEPEPEPEAPLELPEIDVKSASELDFRRVGISAWKVKVKIGLVYDFSDIKTLRKYISDGRVTNEDVISHNGEDWTTLGDIPDLDAHFIDVYRHALARNPEVLRATVASTETSEELSEEAQELTNSILQQINQEVDSSPPPPSSVGPEFSDPFQELKKAQRSRGAQRKKLSKARERHKAELGRQNRLGVLLLGILLAVLFVINPFSSEETVSSVDGVEDDPSLNAMADLEVDDGPSEVEREAQAALARKLRIAQAEKREQEASEMEEPQRRVVRPPEALVTNNEANASASTAQSSTTPAMSPARRAKRAYRQGNYSAAVEAFKEVMENSGGNPSPDIHLGYGKALYHTGKFDRSMRHLIRAEKAGVADREAYRFLIELHRQRGDDAGVNTYTQKLSQLR